MRLAPFAILGLAGLLILAFQNFSHVPMNQNRATAPDATASEFRSREETSPIESTSIQPQRLSHHLGKIRDQSRIIGETRDQQGIDIRDLAPQHRGQPISSYPAFPPISSHAFAYADARYDTAPGADMKNAGQKIFEQELRPNLRPLEQEWVGRVNRYLAGFVPIESEDWPTSGSSQDESGSDGGDRAPAGSPAFPGLPAGFPGLPGSPGDTDDQDDSSGAFSWKTYRIQKIQLTKANEISLAFAHQTKLSCEVGSGGTRFRVTRPLSSTSSIDFHHETKDSRNSLGLNISW